MNLVQVLNAWGAAWSAFMVGAVIDTTALLALIVVVWLPLRRRASAQLAHGAFCLVLLKLVVPVPDAWGWRQPWESARQAAQAISSWAHASPSATAPPAQPPPVVPPLPVTGDMGPTLADFVVQRPSVIAETGAAPARAPGGPALARSSVVATPAPASLSLAAWIMIGWASGAALLLARFCRDMIVTGRLVRAAVPLAPGSLAVDLDALARSSGLRWPVRWGVNFDLHSPAVGGLWRPSVILPPDLGESLSPKQLTWVLLHELAHIRRGDLWVVVFQRTVQAVFFFHPVVHLANWIIDELREYACDDAALAACQASRRVCGEGFLAIVERSVERAPVASAALGLFESRLLIRRRLIRILDDRRRVRARLSAPGACGLLVLGIAVLAFGRPRDVAEYRQDHGGSSHESTSALVEPASFRPGVVWRGDASGDERGGGGNTSLGRGVVLALAYSPDGSTLASAGDDAVVILRHVASGQVIGRLEGHGDTVSCLAFSPDGQTLATGSYDRTVRLWDVATGRARATLSGHANWVFSVAFSADGRALASAGHDKMVRAWDVATGRETATLAGHSASVRAVAFAPTRDGNRWLASGGADRLVILWDLGRRSPLARLVGHKGTVRALAVSTDGATLATGGEDGEVRLWDVLSGRERGVLLGHSDMVTSLAFSPRGTMLASGSLDTTVKLWDRATGRERASSRGHTDGVSAVAFAPTAQQMATGSFDGTVRLWEPAPPIFSPSACLSYPGEARGVAFSPDGRSVHAAGASGTARWDAVTGSPLASAVNDEATSIAIAPDGHTYATGGPDGKVRLVDSATDRVIAAFDGHKGSVRTLAFAPMGRLLASGGDDGVVCLWDDRTRRKSGALPASPLPVTCVRFAPDGHTLAVSTGDPKSSAPGSVTTWDVASQRRRGAAGGHEGSITSVEFSPDGALVATAGADGFIRFWDAASLSPRDALRDGPCQSVAFSPDGRYLASADERGDVVLWDVAEARQAGLLKGHRDRVFQVVFSPDGRTLATAGKDRAVKLWGLATRRQTARATLRGEFTPVGSLAYSPDGKTLAVADGPADAPGTVTLLDLATRKVKNALDGHRRGVGTLAFSPDGRRIASGSCEGTIRIWDAAGGEAVHEMTGLSGLTELAFSPDGTRLASAGEGKVVTLWNVATGSEESKLTGFRWPVQSVAFSPDGKLLATGGGTPESRAGAEGELKIWDVATRTVVRELAGHTRKVVAVAFSPDGQRLATAGLDETIRIWDVNDGRQQLHVGGLPSRVAALAFSRDGRMVAWSGRGDGLVALLDAATGAEVARLVGHVGPVRGIAFAPDGTGLATAGADRTVKLWDIPSPDLSSHLSSQR